MTRTTFAFCVALVLGLQLPLTTVLAQGDAKTDKEQLQGTWRVETLEMAGMAMPDEVTMSMSFVFKGDKMIEVKILSGNRYSAASSFKLGTGKQRKTIDLLLLEGAEKGKKTFGVYEVSGDTLKLCLGAIGTNNRPTDFKSPLGTATSLFVLKRETATSGAAGGQAPPKQLSVIVENIRELSNPMTLEEFLTYTRERFKVKIEINSAAFMREGPEFDVRDSQIKLNIPAGMTLGTVFQAALDQIPVPSTYSVKGDRIIIGPGLPSPLKDMRQTSPLRTKFTATLKLHELGVKEKAVPLKDLVALLSEKVKAPIYLDSAAIRTVGPADIDTPDIGELEINFTKLKDGNALQILQQAILQLQDGFPGVQLNMQADHLRVTATRKKKAPEM